MNKEPLNSPEPNMKVITLTALITTIVISTVGAIIEVNVTDGTFYSGLYYFAILTGTLIIPLFILTWIYLTLVSKLSAKNYFYRLVIGLTLAITTLFTIALIDKIPNLLETGYFFVGSGILLTFIHLIIERLYIIVNKQNSN